uniref:Uncharacterized protein n=1 Tax=Kalanchoe fedtschenkoi TaxID=63787 RepID=A0A7N1A0F6_KALFE
MDVASDSDTASVWSTSSSVVTKTTTSVLSRDGRELDPLLKDLSDKKQSFRRTVVSLAAELKDVRSRLSSQEQSFTKETLTRQEAEAKAKKLEEELHMLQQSLVERNGQLEASASIAKQYLKELDNVKLKLATTQSIAEASSAAAHSAQFQCVALVKELEAKEYSLKEHEDRVNKLAEQLAVLQEELSLRESSQNLLKAEVSRIEAEISQALVKAGASNECELQRLLEAVSPDALEQMSTLLASKDEEIANLKEAVGILSAEWGTKNKELELQLEKRRKADQDLKKRVMKLEFCLQEARAQTRKLHRMGERREKAIKELQDQISTKKQGGVRPGGDDKQKIWDRPSFKVVASLSMLILVVFSKR